MPHPESRFYDSSPIDDPLLPCPGPKLYDYQLPFVPERDPSRFSVADHGAPEASSQDDSPTDSTSNTESESESAQRQGRGGRLQRLIGFADDSYVIPASAEQSSGEQPRDIDERQDIDNEREQDADAPESDPAKKYTRDAVLEETQGQLQIAKIPKDAWRSLPQKCLVRMFEFQSVRDEYARTEGKPPGESQLDDAQRLALEDILELSLINSREYQTQKEFLYAVALRLTLERYAYQMKFTFGGTGTDLNYSHNRAGGTTVNGMTINSGLSIDKMLSTGGDFIAQFANDVVLTFNGASGFEARAGSRLVGRFEQAIFQRDVRFESLTQSERDVIYAARDFARFRKQFFSDRAQDYYNLLLAYRNIEIRSQDFFSNLRGFNQARAEYDAGQLPRFQVDQFEQQVLESRRTLIENCVRLESSFDNLKLRMGLPPEMPINLDIRELEAITQRDEGTVSEELLRRARRNLANEREQAGADENVLLNGAIVLVNRALNLIEVRSRGRTTPKTATAFRQVQAELLAHESRLLVRLSRDLVDADSQATLTPPPLQVYFRTMELVEAQLTLVERLLIVADWREVPARKREPIIETLERLHEQYEKIVAELESAVETAEENRQAANLQAFVNSSRQLLTAVDKLANDAEQMLGVNPQIRDEQRTMIIADIDRIADMTSQLFEEGTKGLAPIEIDADDAMLTALSQRYDVMNAYGDLADAWRQIKYRGDDLKSILNLSASQTIRTPADANRPFDFSFDDSQTSLGISFDAPFNRRSQRNTFRLSLINYNVALRALIALQDNIKLNIRNDLRQLDLVQQQYEINVASAALAYERVVTTRLQLRLGVQNVTARDVLESQRAYTASLSSVAQGHIDYIGNRIQLFLDLELLQVDDSGFWPETYNDSFQPIPQIFPPACSGPAYGFLVPGLWYSDCIRRMECIPYCYPQVHQHTDAADEAAEESASSILEAGPDSTNETQRKSGPGPSTDTSQVTPQPGMELLPSPD
ncbi:MAG: TolC family protein [Pirellulaceae bacterium]|nr:TolC family protein [Planctomycetales bacterium]